jgi:multicopper oxidase
VTQRIAQGETFDMSWSPDRPGRWLFHCHMLVHMNPPSVPPLPGLDVRPAAAGSDHHGAVNEAMGMGQLGSGHYRARCRQIRGHHLACRS